MPVRFSASIGGILYSIVAYNDIPAPEQGVYSPFLNADSPSFQIEIPVEIITGTPGLPETSSLVFSMNERWSVYKTGTVYAISFTKETKEHPSLVAEYDSSVDTLKITSDWGYQNPFHYPVDQIVTMIVLSKINGFICHSSGIVSGNDSFVFAGSSGAGKSTISRLLIKNSLFNILSDDRIIIKKDAGTFRAYGTPWPGEAKIVKNESAPLRGFFFLHKSDRSFVKGIGKKEAMRQLLPVSSIPWYDPETADRVLETIEMLINEIPTFELHFRPDETVIPVIEDAIKKLS